MPSIDESASGRNGELIREQNMQGVTDARTNNPDAAGGNGGNQLAAPVIDRPLILEIATESQPIAPATLRNEESSSRFAGKFRRPVHRLSLTCGTFSTGVMRNAGQ